MLHGSQVETVWKDTASEQKAQSSLPLHSFRAVLSTPFPLTNQISFCLIFPMLLFAESHKRYHFSTLISKTLKIDNIFCWWGCGQTGTLIHCWWKHKLAQTLWREIWQYLARIYMYLHFDPAIPLLGLNIENTKVYLCKDIYCSIVYGF